MAANFFIATSRGPRHFSNLMEIIFLNALFVLVTASSKGRDKLTRLKLEGCPGVKLKVERRSLFNSCHQVLNMG